MKKLFLNLSVVVSATAILFQSVYAQMAAPLIGITQETQQTTQQISATQQIDLSTTQEQTQQVPVPATQETTTTQQFSATQESTQQMTGTQQSTQQQIYSGSVFSDVNNGDDHYVALEFLKQKGIIQGYSDGTFQPLKQINRAEALKIILNAIAKPQLKNAPKTTSLNFSDVDTTAWYMPYINLGMQNGIIDGYPDGTFHPERTVNKVEALKMALLEDNYELPVTISTPPYSDVPVDSWFAPYAQVSQDIGLILESRTDGSLSPADRMNRGDFAELIYRLIESGSGYHFGRATYYAGRFAGQDTASGTTFNPSLMTAAHKTLPFGTVLLVTNMANGQSVQVTVNDRGPYATGVELDLSESAFAAIADPSTGIITMQYQIISEPNG